MGAINNVYGNIAASFFLWIGSCFGSPASASILTVFRMGCVDHKQTTTNPEYQGTVLSWNNFCYSSSLIVSPLVLSAIYPYNKEAIYYFSSIFGIIGMFIMGYMATWPNANIIGKKSVYNDDLKSVELHDLKVEKTTGEGAIVSKSTEEVSTTEGTSEDKSKDTFSVPTEKQSIENDQTPTDKSNYIVCFHKFTMGI